MRPLVLRELGAPLGLGAAPPAPSPIPLGTSLLSRKHGAEPHVHPDMRANSKTPHFGKAQAFRGLLKPLTVSESQIRPALQPPAHLHRSFWGCFLRFGHRRSERGWHCPAGPNFGCSAPHRGAGMGRERGHPVHRAGCLDGKGAKVPTVGGVPVRRPLGVGPWVLSPARLVQPCCLPQPGIESLFTH